VPRFRTRTIVTFPSKSDNFTGSCDAGLLGNAHLRLHIVRASMSGNSNAPAVLDDDAVILIGCAVSRWLRRVSTLTSTPGRQTACGHRLEAPVARSLQRSRC
jgi:hypothetical protein